MDFKFASPRAGRGRSGFGNAPVPLAVGDLRPSSPGEAAQVGSERGSSGCDSEPTVGTNSAGPGAGPGDSGDPGGLGGLGAEAPRPHIMMARRRPAATSLTQAEATTSTSTSMTRMKGIRPPGIGPGAQAQAATGHHVRC